jgi:hypothetical protein
MKTRSKFLSAGLAAVLAIGIVAAPATASAQRVRRSSTHSEDTSRNNAIALGAAGLLLLGNHQSTLGTIALGVAATQVVKMQNDISNRHNRESRYGYNDNRYRYNDNRYDSRYDSRNDYRYSGNDRYGNTPHGIYSDGGYYDQLGGYHKPGDGYDAGYRDQFGGWHATPKRNDNCNDKSRGRDWASTRGNKRGWDKNGKRDRN